MLQALKAAGVEFIVAPFEADAQMAYLAINGMVHAVITEDSDMLPYGCPRVSIYLSKLCTTSKLQPEVTTYACKGDVDLGLLPGCSCLLLQTALAASVTALSGLLRLYAMPQVASSMPVAIMHGKSPNHLQAAVQLDSLPCQ